MPSSLLCKEELLKLIRAKSRAGAEGLYDQYAVVLRLAIFRIVRQKDLTDAILEKTICEIWDTTGLYKEQYLPFVTWILAIAKITAQKYVTVPVEAISA